MNRYFLEISYKGTNYAGVQVQDNANTVQAELEKALSIFFKAPFQLTCSSRTDAGVHALKNYFHFDSDVLPVFPKLEKAIYNLNALLPPDIVISQIIPVSGNAHSRFDARCREYKYFIYTSKNPFLADRAYFFPYPLDIELLNEAAATIKEYTDFTSFSKRNTQVKTFNCTIFESFWQLQNGQFVYTVRANRFLRGMVRGLVGTMLKLGTGKISLGQFKKIIESQNCTLVDFSVPPQGLFLVDVVYPDNQFLMPGVE
ncbi:MAG TPA: tRNA pseudouridine(38-40) synthase TruA [Ferruginibacter sp.]|nr:tRNA pseudouridine(38-40) synthase TruA [Ferruginibacter sp.]HMP21729.1 tRNA pseudouridine(38-40) synthase TruA [Ferruginibacter sp.]